MIESLERSVCSGSFEMSIPSMTIFPVKKKQKWHTFIKTTRKILFISFTNWKYFPGSGLKFLKFLYPGSGFIFFHRTFYIHLLIFFSVFLSQLEYKLFEDRDFCLSFFFFYSCIDWTVQCITNKKLKSMT